MNTSLSLFLATALAPFAAVLLLLIARPFLILTRKLPEGWIRRLLLSQPPWFVIPILLIGGLLLAVQ